MGWRHPPGLPLVTRGVALSPDHDDEPAPAAARYLPATRRGWIASVVAMLYVAGTIGYVIGAREGGQTSPDPVDVGFLQDMITHHEQAIEMSNIELVGGVDPDVQGFAREILTFQAYEVGVMEGRLAEWGLSPQDRSDTAMAWMGLPVPTDRMPGMASADELRLLRQAVGVDVDALFVPLMQDHHRGGVHMADFAAAEASDPAVRELAARMARNQRIEIAELAAASQRAGLDPAPDGYVPDVTPGREEAAGHGEHGG